MKHLLLDHQNVILHISDTIGYQSNGNPLVDHGTLAYAAILVAKVEAVEAVPEGVSAQRYCYENGEFVPNPNWVEPGTDESAAVDAVLDYLEGGAKV